MTADIRKIILRNKSSVIVLVTWLCCFFIGIIFFANNRSVLNELYIKAGESNNILSIIVPTEKQASTDHLKHLQELQKKAMFNDAVYLIYILLNTSLIGACLLLTIKNKENVKEASEVPNEFKKNIAKINDDIEKTINLKEEIAVRLKIVEEDFITVKKDSSKVNDIINKLNKLNKNMTDCLQGNEKINNICSQMKMQNAILSFMVIRVAILYAIEELDFGITEKNNERINDVCEVVEKLADNTRNKQIMSIQKDLSLLQKEIDKYRKKVEKLPEDDKKASQHKATQKKACEWSVNKLNSAINRCNELLNEGIVI